MSAPEEITMCFSMPPAVQVDTMQKYQEAFARDCGITVDLWRGKGDSSRTTKEVEYVNKKTTELIARFNQFCVNAWMTQVRNVAVASLNPKGERKRLYHQSSKLLARWNHARTTKNKRKVNKYYRARIRILIKVQRLDFRLGVITTT